MSLSGLLLTGLAALLVVASNLMLRAGVMRAGGFSLSLEKLFSDLLALVREPLVVVALVVFGVAALLWFRVISTEHLSTAYPLLVGLSFVLITLGAVVLFHEPIHWQKVLGIGIILAGIVLVARVGT